MKKKNTSRLKIAEIFYSFQGESTLAGRPTLFIRLAGCNLSCSICDTLHALKGGRNIPIDKILDIAEHVKTKFVCITGGEPLMQKNTLKKLIRGLLDMNKYVSIETNGSISIVGLDKRVKMVVDVKTPSTGEAGNFYKQNLKQIASNDEIKFVISDRNDFNFAVRFINYEKIKTNTTILFSPNLAVPGLSKRLLSWIIKDELPVIFQPQLHKLIKEEPIHLL